MAYSADTFTAGEQPTTAKWNKLWANDAAMNDGTGIAASAITPEKLQSGTGTSWAWTSWTPTWTNLTIGNATVDCKYQQIGKMLEFYMCITIGSTTSVGSNPAFTVPVTSITYPSAFFPYGPAEYSNGAGSPGHITYNSTTTAVLRRWDANNDNGSVTSSLPFAWTTGNFILGQGKYLVP